MSPSTLRRKVLIVEDEPTIRNVLFSLLSGLGCEGCVAYNGQQALARISRESFDAILLDIRCSNPPVEEVVSRIEEINPNLVGRVLVITGEVTDPKTVEFIEHHFLLQVPRDRLFQDLQGTLRALMQIRPTPRRAI